MRRNLRAIPSLFQALRNNTSYDPTSQHIKHPLLSLSRHPTFSTKFSSFSNSSITTPEPTSLPPSFTPSIDEEEESDHEFELDPDDEIKGCRNTDDPVSRRDFEVIRDILQTPGVQEKSETRKESDHELELDPDDEFAGYRNRGDSDSRRDFETIRDILQTPGVQEKSKKLELCGVKVTHDLVSNVLSATRNDWETAFTFFLWAGKQPGYEHSLREYHSMIAILGKFRKFDTAWGVIEDMKGLGLVTPHTVLIMIRKYAAVHDVAKAISAFYGLRRFKLDIGMDEFQGLLSALSRYKNVKDAEHLLFCNKDTFPLNTKSFNIILNGWCNVIGSPREGKRIWKEMESRRIKHDAYSYGSVMSCYSKANNLNLILKLYEKMKTLSIKPDRKVYNAVIHSMAKGRLVNEAESVLKLMEDEGITPDAATYNSLIMPLCKSRMLDEAKQVFDEMIERGQFPNVRTYHAFLRALRTGEEVFELLQKMHETGCNPSHDTYIMLIRKFCRWRQLDNVFKVWAEMSKNGLDPDRSSYIVLIHGLFLNGRLDEAHKYYLEMKEKGLVPEPKIDAMLQSWIASREDESIHSGIGEKVGFTSRKIHKENDFLRQPELRSVTRERGFSFWDR